MMSAVAFSQTPGPAAVPPGPGQPDVGADGGSVPFEEALAATIPATGDAGAEHGQEQEVFVQGAPVLIGGWRLDADVTVAVSASSESMPSAETGQGGVVSPEAMPGPSPGAAPLTADSVTAVPPRSSRGLVVPADAGALESPALMREVAADPASREVPRDPAVASNSDASRARSAHMETDASPDRVAWRAAQGRALVPAAHGDADPGEASGPQSQALDGTSGSVQDTQQLFGRPGPGMGVGVPPGSSGEEGGAEVATRARSRPAEVRADAPPAAAAVVVPDTTGEERPGAETNAEGEQNAAPSSQRAQARVSGPAAPLPLTLADATSGMAQPPPGPSPAGPYSMMTPEERAGNLGRLVQSMRVLVRDGISEAVVRLRPEHLGEVSISLRLDGRSVSAVVRADTAGVREWLQSQHDVLRQGLALQGLDLEKLDVEPDDRRRGAGHQDPEEPRRERPRDSDSEARFVVTA